MKTYTKGTLMQEPWRAVAGGKEVSCEWKIYTKRYQNHYGGSAGHISVWQEEGRNSKAWGCHRRGKEDTKNGDLAVISLITLPPL